MSDVRFQIFLKSRKSMLISYGIRRGVKIKCPVTLKLHWVFPIKSQEVDSFEGGSAFLLIFLLDEVLSMHNQLSIPVCQIVGYKRSEEHTSELQSRFDLVCRLMLDKKNSTPI